MTQTALITESPKTGQSDRAAFLLVDDPVVVRGVAWLWPQWALIRHILRVAMPVVLGMLTQTAINILDTVMIGRLPPEIAIPGQAAIGPSLVFMWMVGGFLSAVWVGTQAITSRRAGEGNAELAGRALTNSLLLAVSTSIAFSAVFIFLVPAVLVSFLDPGTVELGSDYLRIRLVGITAMVATFSYKSFFDGIGKTHIFMSAAVLMNIFNIVLNFLLIYGNESLGIPRLGVQGAAWASVIAAYSGLFILVGWSLLPSLLSRYRYYRSTNINGWVLKEIIRLSLPNGLATLVVMAGFGAFYWVVGQVNDLVAEPGNPYIGAANQALVTVCMLTFMSSLAVGSATAAIVSQCIGAQRPRLGGHYAWESVKLWAVVTWLYGVLMLMFPDALLGLINTDPDVINAARSPLRMLAVLQGVIATAMILAQTLYGVGNAKFVMYVELVCHLVFMAPVAYICGLVLGWGLNGVYLAPVLYAAVLCSAMIWKFRRGDWKDNHF